MKIFDESGSPIQFPERVLPELQLAIMEHELSPAVERARDAAANRSPGAPRHCDWLFCLIEDDDARPAELLRRLKIDVDHLRNLLTQEHPDFVRPAPSERDLFSTAREKAITLRGDPTLTSEFLLIALIDTDRQLEESLAAQGLVLGALENLLHTRPVEMVPEPDSPEPTFVIEEPRDRATALRILDANLNRAREAFRVLDDYARFALNDPTLTELLKTARHDLVQAAKLLPESELLTFRNTLGDVGQSLSARGEYERTSPSETALINFRRLQEALRSLEEYGKIFGSELGRKIESIRYRTYVMERTFYFGVSARERLAQARLYVLLTGSQSVAALDWTIEEAATGGAEMFQLREKTLTDRELLARAIDVRKWTRRAGKLFIMNDRPDIAALVEADGVHLGQDDLSVAAARKIVGSDALIGVSTHNLDQVRRAVLEGADYLGAGPVFPSATKAFSEFPGTEFLRAAASATSLPLFALGGITTENLGEVLATGIRRIAVAAAVTTSDDPQAVSRTLRAGLGVE